MMNAVPGKDPCPRCGQLLIGGTSKEVRPMESQTAVCVHCQTPFWVLEEIERVLLEANNAKAH